MVTGVKGRDGSRGSAGWRLVALAVALTACCRPAPRGHRDLHRPRQHRAGPGHRRQARGEADPRRQARQEGRRARRPARSAGSSSARSSPAAATRCKQGSKQSDRFRVLSDKSAPPEHRRSTTSRCRAERLRLPDDPRRHQARDQRAICRGRSRRARIRPWSSTPATATPTRTAARARSSRSADLLGYAVVDVNMRGTGCSGGAFDFFEPLQGLDGYDVIETVARQPWVLNDKVGMVGDLLRRDQPALRRRRRGRRASSAITPLSVIDNTQTTLYPGGILNTGFALEWAKDRVHDSQPASPTTGPGLGLGADPERRRDLQGKPAAAPGGGQPAREDRAQPATTSRRSPTRWRRSRSSTRSTSRRSWPASGPTSRPAATARRWPPQMTGTDKKWFTFTNGTHIDSLDPETFNRWYDFLELYVAERKPRCKSRAIGRRAGRLRGRDGRPRRHPAARPDPGRARLRVGAGGVRGPSRRSGSCSTTAPAATCPATRCPGSSSRSTSSRSRGTKARSLLPRRRRRARLEARRRAAARTSSTGTPAARPPTDFTGDTGRRPERPLDRDPAV